MANSKKNKQIKKRKVTDSEIHYDESSSDRKENRPKRKKITIVDLRDGIAMSKQLLLNKTKNLQNRRTTSLDVTRICGNGIPLPSLAELERMYDDDSDEELSSISTPQKNSTTIESPEIPEIILNENKLLSPTTIQKISERLMNIISDPTELLNQNVPPPPVIPQRKRKKPEEPYIVGCKERPQVAHNPSTNFCKGDEDYGVDASSAEPDSPPGKRAKKSKIPSYSKSIFNAKSDEIAEKLAKNNDNTEETNYESSDSNKTIEYVPSQIPSPKQSSFSPLPSTSRDSETFNRNEELFNQSLRENTLIDESSTPQKTPNATIDNITTIVIDDDDEDDIEIIPTLQTGTNPGLINEKSNNSFSSMQNSTETINQNNLNNINHHDAYIDITDNDGTEDVSAIIDVDDVIAQNQAILSKFKRNNELNATVTTAETTTSEDNITQNQCIVNSGNGNNVLNNTVTTPVKPTTNMNQTIPPNLKSVPQAIECLRIRSVGLNPSTGHSSDVSIERPTLPEQHTTRPSLDKITHNSSKPSIYNNLAGETIKKLMLDYLKHKPIAMSQSLNSVILRVRKHILDNILEGVKESLILLSNCKNTDNSLDAPIILGECPICLGLLSTANRIASTLCGHMFCLKCIQAAIKVNGNTCPTCRKRVRVLGGYHRVYF